nr:alpha/beta hydrolase-fold protein [uncultured Celeribacter sp.]
MTQPETAGMRDPANLSSADLSAEARLAGTPWQPPGVQVFDVGTADTRLRVLVSTPEAPPAATGYGIIYALDAGWTFGSLHDAALMQAPAKAAGQVRPTVIVGLGWPTANLIDHERREIDLVGGSEVGPGLRATLGLLETQIISRVEAALPVDPQYRMILGHSYGGAFALQARRLRPGLFSHVAAGSPSIWTDPEALFAGASPDGADTLITLGALEDPDAAAASGTPADRVERLRSRNMAGRAKRMAESLDARFMVFPDVAHGAAVIPFIGASMAFLWAHLP